MLKHEFISQVALRAGAEIIKTSAQVIKQKGFGGDVLTQADLASEKLVVEMIHAQYPDHHILSEESYSEITAPESIEHLWIIDPVDGTSNLSNGIPFFTVTLAYANYGKLKLAATYDPNRKELFSAEKGKGAFLNGLAIHVQDRTDFNNAMINLDAPHKPENFRRNFKPADAFHSRGARIVNFCSSALVTAYVACGRLSLFYVIGLKPWDIAAGKLIIEEAGGVMEELDGELNIFVPNELLMGNKKLVDQAREIIKNL